MTAVTDVSTALAALAITRVEENIAHDSLTEMVQAFQSTEQYKSATAKLDQLTKTAAELEKAVRVYAIGDYNQSVAKEKHPNPYVEIKIVTRYGYEEEKALSWCLANMPAALKLNRVKFDLVAKTGVIANDIVTVLHEPQAYIARDLSPLLPSEAKTK